MPVRAFLSVLLLWLTLGVARAAVAHPLSLGSARLEKQGTELQGELVLDVPRAVLAKDDAARRSDLVRQVSSGFRVEVASGAVSPAVRIEDLGRGQNAVDIVSVRFQIGSAESLRFASSAQLGDVAIELVDAEHTFRQRVLLSAGEESRWVPLSASVSSSSAPSAPGAPAKPTAAPSPVAADTRSLPDYLRLGFFHIVPNGIDHLLFVTSLVLLTRRFRQLLGLVSLFTVGHALSVALAVYGIAALGSRWVEPLIALSLTYGAIEWHKPDVSVARPAVTLGFGLVHGLGFAGALGRVGVAAAERPFAIVGFNVGVEVGQVTVASVPLLLLLWLEKRHDTDGLRGRALLVIATIGASWAFLRIIGADW